MSRPVKVKGCHIFLWSVVYKNSKALHSSKIMTKGTPSSSSDVKRIPRKAGKWSEHVRQYRELHKVSFKEALKGAGESYVKLVRPKKDRQDYKENPWMLHIREWKTANPDWKTTLSYKEVLKTCKETYTTKVPVVVKEETTE